MRDEIIEEIRRLATANGGQPPGVTNFERETGIAEHQWRGKIWARWGDALAEAGFEPNALTQRMDSDVVLSEIIKACRHYGHFPTNSELKLYKHSTPSLPSTGAITRHFGRQSDLIAALAARAKADEALSDIRAMLPVLTPEEPARPAPTSSLKSIEGSVYLIKSGEFYKIGRSDDLERRVKEIRIALPDKATLVHTIRTDDPAGIEAYWHRRFADQRANGEWFKLTSLDVSAFRKRRFQ